jgi:transmembrane 9 superfamily protein 2/4
MKVLRSDIVRYMGIDDLEDDLDGDPEDEAGWKLIHGHVFRAPEPTILFASMIGVGAQFFTMIMALLGLALLGIFSPMRRGGVSTCAVLLYTVTSFIGGYVSSRLYRQLSKGNGNWVWTAGK